MPNTPVINSVYLTVAFNHNTLHQRVTDICKFLRNKYRNNPEKPTLVFRGLSGALIVPLLAYKLKYPLLTVRKNENSHTSNIVEGNISFTKYVIVDDFICTGETIEQIQKNVYRNNNKATLDGIVLYNSTTYNPHLKRESRKFNCWIKSINKNHNRFVKP